MVPYEIGILLHYYARVGDHPDIERRPPIYQPTIAAFVELGLLQVNKPGEASLDDGVYAIAPRGKAYIDALQRVPLPVQVWVIPEAEAQR